MTAVIVIVVLLALLLFASSYFFRYTFLRADKPDPWNDGLGEFVLKDRAFFERPDRELLEITARDGLRLKAWFYDQGGGVLEVNAFNGPALVTVTDAMALMEGAAEPAMVRFYVRQGEVGQTNLPAGTYLVQYQVGYRWFGPEKGFGEYCTEGMLEEPLTFDFYMDGQWASNAKFTITL